MTLRTGTATPWAEWQGTSQDEGIVVYLRDGHNPGEIDYLAEQLRIDGFAWTLGDAYRRAEQATLSLTWWGYVDEEPEFCTGAGLTTDGDEVDEPRTCVVAVMTNAS